MKILKIFVLGISLWAIERHAHRATDGFAVVNIFSPKYEKLRPAPVPEGVKEILDQPFSYLNCGAQSYVFASADGKYVLKFFKFQHMRLPPFLDKAPFLQEKRKRKEAIYRQAMESCHIAYTELKEETGIVYAHLGPSDFLNKRITIQDKLGIFHSIDLDKVEFVLQRKATLAYDQINTWMASNEVSRARAGVASLVQLAKTRCKKGIFDKDPDFATNFGFIGSTPIEIDVGRFSYDEKERLPQVYEDELFRITRPFKQWLCTHHPDLGDAV